ncbi:DUF6476 family protein [Roseovarius nanhaiticus]|uniref:Uncharacterized protein n=1 Tax=Roseovarius nanhaiticus TaxID=573024 RepID=A0A1N7HD08_9RHOB|nr:DUF6476 family protein [Roseovarius nanhaiticus]SEL02251.1 hypothetical protein SAMN05216208_2557 [Roseovarius nanhaiticus]SIS22653.1 hypothetical protein SAMN05421666_2758 [Roseovarius nanhaiticus]
MDEDPQMQPVDPALVRYLRVLVTVLTATMIIGFIVIVALFVTRFGARTDLTLPEAITVPEGAAPVAFTQSAGWFAIVTDADEILIYDRASGELRQTLRVDISD